MSRSAGHFLQKKEYPLMLSVADMLVSNSTENRYPNIDYIPFSPILPTFIKINHFREYRNIYNSIFNLVFTFEFGLNSKALMVYLSANL